MHLLPHRPHGQIGGLGIGAGGHRADHLALAALRLIGGASIHAGNSAGAHDVQAATGVGHHAGGSIVAQAADHGGDGDHALVAGLRASTQSIVVGCLKGRNNV